MKQNVMSIEAKKDESWIHNKWRPAIGWSYMAVCVFDFMIAPIFYIMIQVILGADVSAFKSWVPVTTTAGGLYHISMLAIVGATSYGRTQEKLQRVIQHIKNGSSESVIEKPEPEPEPEPKPRVRKRRTTTRRKRTIKAG